MAAGEDQSEPIVFDALIVQRRNVARLTVELFADRRLRRIETNASPHRVDALETAGCNEPRPWIIGHTFFWPTFKRGAKRIVERVFSKVEVAQQADQGRQDSARFRAINLVHAFTYLIGCVLSHCDRPYAILFSLSSTKYRLSCASPAGASVAWEGPVQALVRRVTGDEPSSHYGLRSTAAR